MCIYGKRIYPGMCIRALSKDLSQRGRGILKTDHHERKIRDRAWAKGAKGEGLEKSGWRTKSSKLSGWKGNAIGKILLEGRRLSNSQKSRERGNQRRREKTHEKENDEKGRGLGFRKKYDETRVLSSAIQLTSQPEPWDPALFWPVDACCTMRDTYVEGDGEGEWGQPMASLNEWTRVTGTLIWGGGYRRRWSGQADMDGWNEGTTTPPPHPEEDECQVLIQ